MQHIKIADQTARHEIAGPESAGCRMLDLYISEWTAISIAA